MAAVSIEYTALADALAGAEAVVVIGRKGRLAAPDVLACLPAGAAALWPRMLDSLKPGDSGASTGAWLAGDDGPSRLVAAAVPEACSRHNSPARPDAIKRLVAKACGRAKQAAVVLALDDADHALAAGLAVAQAFPLYSHRGAPKGGADDGDGDEDNSAGDAAQALRVALLGPGGEASPPRLAALAEGVRRCGRLVDMPTSELDTDAFVAEARAVAERLGAAIEVIAGADLDARGFGGLWGVGKAATAPPALVHLSWTPAGAERTIAWVGKGIVYDTGGLSIKGKEHMPGMKGDMGGAAAVLGAFEAAVSGGVTVNLHALLCLAENSVGPAATRPDDILTLYSGKTVEINNTDAEGRLVLGDGVAYATKHLAPDVVIDLATLTGAQLLATGKKHAAIVCNDDALEAQAVAAGKRCGDLVFPLPYCPEFFRKEFKSKVADLKNSVKDRMNAQASCAAQFVAEHLAAGYAGGWLHVDLAGPSGDGERGTGFGVALLVALLDADAPA